MVTPTQPTREQFTAYDNLYKYFNEALFRGRLPPVLLNFSRQAKTYGFFAPERWHANDDAEARTHEISLNPAHLGERPARDTCSTLVHEMCHLWQQVHGSPPRRGYHDREWSAKMKEIGLIPVDRRTGLERHSAHSLSHRIDEEGAFARAFAEMPPAYLLPWSCIEVKAPPRKRKGGTGGEGEGAGEDGESEPKSRNKVKYTCPGCSANVWGKPQLAIVCGTCTQPFALA